MQDDISAHGVGGQKDLPIPLDLAVAGAVAALVLSFVILAVAWRKPRYEGIDRCRPAPATLARVVDSMAWRTGLRVVGLLIFVYAVLCAVFGKNLGINPIVGIFYIYWWVGLVAASFLFGPVWKAISPVRSINWMICRLTGGESEVDDDGERRMLGLRSYPERLGYWPAALGLFAFVWIELVYRFPTEVGPIRLWCAIYVALMLVGGAVYGDRFYERADPFEVYSTLIGKLSIWGRREGALVVRSPLANLAGVEVAPGLFAVVCVLLGSTAYDSFRESPTWVSFVQGSDVDGYLLTNLGLLGFCALALAIFAVACMATRVESGTSRRSLPDALANSVVPIVLGYMVAHYTTLLVEAGQRYLVYASDPLSRGDDWFVTADLTPNLWLSEHPGLLATIKVLAVVTGHVVGVIAAHDRAISLLPRRDQLTGQLPLLAAMVIFTGGGLYLLFSA